MRLRIVIGLLICGSIQLVQTFAFASPTDARSPRVRVVAQEGRPTAPQPSPGVPFTRPDADKPWSYNWVARPLIAIFVLFVLALGGGYLMRWVGIGRRTS